MDILQQKQFTKGTDSTTFTYGPIEAVTKKCNKEVATTPPSPLNTSVKSMSKSNKNTNTEHKHFIYLDKQLIAIHIKTTQRVQQAHRTQQIRQQPPIPDKTRYLHYDNLGSLTPSPMDKATSLRE
ncbi:hypothetical protein BSPWISOXPB_1193 [uncultured Gammaproteobacteria bacterium]|nr:hypothetical protein BSPWISOXPB_1193 [uncultured Gammaproteobacteria bacterium]